MGVGPGRTIGGPPHVHQPMVGHELCESWRTSKAGVVGGTRVAWRVHTVEL